MARVLRGLAVLKLGLLGFLIIWGFALGHGDWSNFRPFFAQRPDSDPLPKAIAIGLVSAFVSFAGWWDACKIAGEMRNPERTLPQALVLGVSIVTVVYIGVSTVFLYLVPPSKIDSNEGFAALAGEALFGPAGGGVFASIVILSVTGSLAAVLMASARVYYTMARDGLFFSAFGSVDPTRGTPARAIALQAVLAIVLAATGTYEEILAFLMVPTLLFLALTVSAVFVLRYRSSLEPPLCVPGYPWSPLVFVIPTLALVGLLIVNNPIRAAIGLLVLIAGVPIAAWVKAHRPLQSADARPLDQATPAPATGD